MSLGPPGLERLRLVVLDTNSFAALIVAAVTGAIFCIIAAADANVIALSRRHLRGSDPLGLTPLLRSYVRVRQSLVRQFRVGSTIAIVTMTAALVVAFEGGEWTRVALAAAIAAVLMIGLGSAARIIALSHPERAAAQLHPLALLLQVPLRLVTWLLSAPVVLPLRAMGLRGSSETIDPAEELIGTIEAVDEDAVLTEERRMVRGVLEMSDQTVRELMTPRTDVTAVSVESTFSDVMRLVGQSGYSRIPLYEGTLDRILGVIYAKDLLAFVQNGNITPHLADVARPAHMVPETKRANELLAEMRRDKVHMAVVVDEYGGTAGVITAEDLVEEIVGAIADEYDAPGQDVQRISDTEAIVDGGLIIDELNELFGTEIESENFDTVGGLIVTELGRLAVPGDEVIAPPLDELNDDAVAVRLQVMSILGRRIKTVRVQRYVAEDVESTPPAAQAV